MTSPPQARRQGRVALLSTAVIDASAPAHQWRLRLAGAAWRASVQLGQQFGGHN